MHASEIAERVNKRKQSRTVQKVLPPDYIIYIRNNKKAQEAK
jgi:hypothetical protein